MSDPVLLDMTRAVTRRFKGDTPTGIDRVCDAYATHFAGKALAVLQMRGRMMVLDSEASGALFASLDRPSGEFRRIALALLAKLSSHMAGTAQTRGALYLNVSHTDFDLDAHWRSIDKQGLRPIYMLHDLIPITHPQVTTPRRTRRHRGRVLQALNHADGIIANSRTTECELREFAASQGLRLPQMLMAAIAGANLPKPLRRLPYERPTFVSVGTVEARKNHTLLLRVWSRLIDRMGAATPGLILVGSWGLRSGKVRSLLNVDSRLRNFVEIRTSLDDAEIAGLVAEARAVLLPTLAEGYGLPMVEALQMQVPVIASDLPSFREVGQGIPSLLDSTDVSGWQQAVEEFCANGPTRKRQLAAITGFQSPTWEAHFAALDGWLANIATSTDDPIREESLPATSSTVHTNLDCPAIAAPPRDQEAQC